MNIEEFVENAGRLVFFDIESLTYFPETGELYNPSTGKSKAVGGIEELLEEKVGGRTVAEIVSDNDYRLLVEFDGGRGSSSESSQTFKFDHAPNNGDNLRNVLFPAEFNDGDKFQSFEKALDKFRERHAGSDHEYGITVDPDGYVHQYIEGGSTSVAISGRDGQIIIHNHPNDSAFSDTDLLSVAQVAGERGIVASGTSGDYIFEKGPKFDGAGFAKAVKSAQMSGKDYNDAVDKWLKKNQDRYGYKYRFRKAG